MNKPTHIAEHWAHMVKSGAFCCEEHAAQAEVMFFSGAMAALHAMTGWDPDVHNLIAINLKQVAEVTEELTLRYFHEQAEVAGQAVPN